MIGFFESEESENAQAYIAAADSQDAINFGIVTSKDVAEGLEATMDSIVLFKSFDDGPVIYSGKYDAESITTFVLTEQLPLVTKFSDEVLTTLCVVVKLCILAMLAIVIFCALIFRLLPRSLEVPSTPTCSVSSTVMVKTMRLSWLDSGR